MHSDYGIPGSKGCFGLGSAATVTLLESVTYFNFREWETRCRFFYKKKRRQFWLRSRKEEDFILMLAILAVLAICIFPKWNCHVKLLYLCGDKIQSSESLFPDVQWWNVMRHIYSSTYWRYSICTLHYNFLSICWACVFQNVTLFILKIIDFCFYYSAV